jgi:hypothetical protein
VREFPVYSHERPEWAFRWQACVTIKDSKGKEWLSYNEMPKDKVCYVRHEAEDLCMAKAILCLSLNRRINGKEPQFEL